MLWMAMANILPIAEYISTRQASAGLCFTVLEVEMPTILVRGKRWSAETFRPSTPVKRSEFNRSFTHHSTRGLNPMWHSEQLDSCIVATSIIRKYSSIGHLRVLSEVNIHRLSRLAATSMIEACSVAAIGYSLAGVRPSGACESFITS